MDSGKDESSAWAICVDSTGLSPHKKKHKANLNKEEIADLVALADELDQNGLHQEAQAIDEFLGLQKKAFDVGFWSVISAISGMVGVGATTLANYLEKRHETKNELKGAYQELYDGMSEITGSLDRALGQQVQKVEDLKKLLAKPSVQNMIRWSRMAQTLKDPIKISLTSLKTIAMLVEDLNKFAGVIKAVVEKAKEDPGLVPSEKPEEAEEPKQEINPTPDQADTEIIEPLMPRRK